MKIVKRLMKKSIKPFFSAWMVLFLVLQIVSGVLAPVSNFWRPSLQKAEAAWLSGYNYRKQITVTGQSGAGTNYQVLLKVGETSGASGENFDLNNHALNFPNDIRFTDNDETTQLDHWLEKTEGTTPNRTAWFWVEVIDDLGSNQNIYAYYGKSGDTSGSSWGNTFAVAGTYLNAITSDANTVGLYHFENNWNDSGSMGDNLTGFGSPSFNSSTKMIGSYSAYMSGNSGATSSSSNFCFSTTASAMAWVKINSWGGGAQSILFKYGGGGYYLSTGYTNGYFRAGTYGSSGGYYFYEQPGFSTGQWHHIAWVFNKNSEQTLYVDGVPNRYAGVNENINCGSSIFTLGGQINASVPYTNQYIDELALWNRAVTSSEVMRYAGVRKYVITEPAFSSAGSEEVFNQSPNAPTLVSPANGSPTNDNTPTLSANYSDTDTGDTGTTNYRIATSAVNCTSGTVVASGTSTETPDNNENTTWTPGSTIGTDGTYYWCAQNNDGVATSSWTSMGNFILDTAAPPAPTLSCTVYTNNTWVSSSASTTCSINDTATPSPRTATAYSTNGGSNWTDNANSLSFSFTPNEGTTNVLMRISDTGGGPTSSNTWIIKRDSSGPTSASISWTTPANSTTPTLTLSATDTNSGMGQMKFSCDNSTWSTAVAYATSYASFNINTGAGCSSGDGAKTVYAQFSDTAGNWSASVNQAGILDTAAPPAPTLSCTVYTNNTWVSSSLSTTCSINDTATPSPRTATAYSTNGGGNWTDNSNSLSFSFTPNEGTTNVLMRISDTGGGPTSSNTWIIKRDSSGPTGASISGITADSTTQLTANGNTATDSNSGLHSTPYYFENTTVPTNSGWQAGTSWISPSLSPNTQYTFRVKSKDVLENESGYSATQSKYTLASQVTGLDRTDGTNKTNYKINLSWTNQSQSGVKIEQDTGCDGYETTAYDDVNDNPATPYSINVSANTCYQFKISSYNGDGIINSVSIPETSQITSPPAQPTGLAHTDNTDDSIDWNWSDVSGATGYKVYDNSDDSLLDTISSATSEWTQDSLDSDTQYSIYVRATNANGEGIASLSASAYTSADTPTNADHTQNTADSITWSWVSGGNEKDFYAWMTDPVADSGWIPGTSWLKDSLTANELYQFFVKARNEEDDQTGSASTSKYTSQNIPTGLTFDNVTIDSITLSADGTFPNLGDDSSGLYFNNVTATQNSGWLQDNEWINSSLDPNTEYSYKVRAQNGDADTTAYTSEEQQYTLAETPGVPVVSAPTINTLHLTIDPNDNPSPTEFAIYETSTDKYVDSSDGSLQNSEDWQTYATFGGASGITVTGLSEATTYTFKVKARNHDDIETVLSASASGTTGNSPDAPTLISPIDGTYTIDTTSTLSAHYEDADTGDTGTTNYRLTDTDAADCLAGLNLVDSGSSSETITNDEDTEWITGVLTDAEYFWCAQNSDGTNTSNWTTMGSFILDTATPDISVVDAGASNIDRISLTSDTWFKYSDTGDDDQISFSWTDPASLSDDTFYYELNSDSGNTIDGTEANTANPYLDDISISEGTSYLHVKPRNGALTWGTERIFTLKYDKSAPGGGSITYADGYYNTASITLTADDGADTGSDIDTTSRIIERKEADLASGVCGAYGAYSTISPAGTYPDFSDTTVVSGNCYQYQYSVSDNLGHQAIYTETNEAKIDTEDPVGTTLALGTITETSITASVSGAADTISGLHATPYYFENTTATTNSGWQSSTDWISSSLSPNTAYTFRVKSRDAAGNESAYTADQIARTLANIPSNLTLTANSQTKITASWSANSNPAGTEYYIENTTRGTNSDWITDTSWVSTGLTAGTNYTFSVKARNTDPTETTAITGSKKTLSATSSDDDNDDSSSHHHESSDKVNEVVSNLPSYISNLPNLITEEINQAIDEEQAQQQQEEDAITIPQEAPPAMKGEWELIEVPDPSVWEDSAFPEELSFIFGKFPDLETAMAELGINSFSDLENMEGVNFELATLADIGLESSKLEASQATDNSLPGQSIPLSLLPPEAKDKIPTEIVFAKTAGEKIDLNINLTITPDGKTEQKVNILSDKNIQLIVKPESEVNNIKGYLVFRSSKLSESNFQFPISNFQNNHEPRVAGVSEMMISLKDALASAVFPLKSLAQEHDPKEIETQLVLQEFEYTDPDADGIYTADIQTPVSEGEYEVITVLNYKSIELGSREIRLITVVDPEGYIYKKISNDELRISNANASLYWLNPVNNNFELWLADKFSQQNPQTTDATGKYSFLVPEGKYYLEVKATGYKTNKSEQFDVIESGGIHMNIKLKENFWWVNIFKWERVVLLILIILVAFNFYRDRKRVKNNN